jgi:hypothetical protein
MQQESSSAFPFPDAGPEPDRGLLAMSGFPLEGARVLSRVSWLVFLKEVTSEHFLEESWCSLSEQKP